MWRIAWNNMAVIGVSVAIALIAIQGAIFLGAIASSSLLVITTDADLWIVPELTTNADLAMTMPDRRRFQALGVAGVERSGRLLVGSGIFRFTNGRQEPVMVVGVDDNYDWMGIDRYRDRRILPDRYVMLDQRDQIRFGTGGKPLAIGDRAEINGHRVELAGVVTGKASFIATPYVFCRYETALSLIGIEPGKASFVMVKCHKGADVGEVRRLLSQRGRDAEVLTRDVFGERCWRYWILGTGIGMALGLSSGLAFVVGTVIVGQTTFTSVLTRIREYATLKAVGFGNPFVLGVVSLQSLAVVLAGYPVSITATLLFSKYAGRGGTAVVMHVSPGLLAAMVPIALLMCGLASLGAVAKALSVPPAQVFR